MWTALLFLWSIPLALGVLALARRASGLPVLSDYESELWLGGDRETKLSLWMAIKFTVLALVFFLAGLVIGIVLLNFSALWIGASALLTGSGAVLFLVLWVRSGPRAGARARRHGAPERLATLLSRIRLRTFGVFAAARRRKQSRKSAILPRRYDDFEL
jgi:hypothetical protein